MTTPTYDAIVFDMDGTLISSEGIYEAAWITLLARRGRALTHETYERHFAGVANRACAEGYLGLRGAGHDFTVPDLFLPPPSFTSGRFSARQACRPPITRIAKKANRIAKRMRGMKAAERRMARRLLAR